jgi:hypothetical protein
LTRELAADVLEAAERAGGTARIFGPLASGTFGVSIGRLPDVGRFLRALASLGVAGIVSYSAGTGWTVAD